MERLYSAEQAREVDRLTSEECHIPSILLMERAALHISERVANVYDNSIRDNVFVKNKKALPSRQRTCCSWLPFERPFSFASQAFACFAIVFICICCP